MRDYSRAQEMLRERELLDLGSAEHVLVGGLGLVVFQNSSSFFLASEIVGVVPLAPPALREPNRA